MSWKLYEERHSDAIGEEDLIELGPFSLFDNWERDERVPRVSSAPQPPTAPNLGQLGQRPVTAVPRHDQASSVAPPSIPVMPGAQPPQGPQPPQLPQSQTDRASIDSLMLYVQSVQRDGVAAPVIPPGGHANGGVAARGPRTSFVCSIPNCEKSFGQKAHLDIHLRSHTGERPFKCPECPKSFSQRGNLKTHMRLHTGEKPFLCPVCNKGFGQRGNLTQHTAIHAEREFECRIDGCAKKFAQLGNLKTHQNLAHQKTVAAFIARLQGGDLPSMSHEEMEMFDYFCKLYKNSNRGIKGRGKGNKVEKVRQVAGQAQAAGVPRITDLPQLPPPQQWQRDEFARLPAWKP